MKYTLVSSKRFGGDWVLTFKGTPNAVEKVLGIRPLVKNYCGNGTAWHDFPSGKRCGTLTEAWLSDVLQGVEYADQPEAIERAI